MQSIGLVDQDLDASLCPDFLGGGFFVCGNTTRTRLEIIMSKIACIGGGPGGLYAAICFKRSNPNHDIIVVERNKADDTFGWGVVLSDQTMENLEQSDPISAKAILNEFAKWDDIAVHFKSNISISGGHGFCGIERKRLLNVLQDRAIDLDVKIIFETQFEDHFDVADFDLVIAADGINSATRENYATHFCPDIDVRSNKYIWLGVDHAFDAFTFVFEELPEGWIWAHIYKYNDDFSTFVVECEPETWRALGFDEISTEACIARLEKIFGSVLSGHKLYSNAKHLRGSAWLNFQRVTTEKWHYNNIVLLGDAAHTAHYSIGSGSKLALEDAISLARHYHQHPILDDALNAYKDERYLEVIKLQSAARNSTEWFENLPRYAKLEPLQFAYSLLTRSQRISHENLRLRDRDWLESVEDWFYEKSVGRKGQTSTPPMFTPYKLRAMELQNRIVVSPMSMYMAKNGAPNDFHLVHYGSRAQGSPGLIYTEMTNVSADGRITPGCAGIYTDEHVVAWKRIVDFVHQQGLVKICMQIGHAGPKGSTNVAWEGMDTPLEKDGWPLIAPSAIPWAKDSDVPREMTESDMDRVLHEHVLATQRADKAGFDMIELHAAHGYLLSSFITPIRNRRTDKYGGSLNNRLRYPLAVFSAMRAVWPDHKPMAVRISATDWLASDGIDVHEAKRIAIAFQGVGCDIIDVSAGQTSVDAKPVYGRMFQTPFADAIENDCGIATMAVGNIYEPDHVNSILAAGRATLCCLGRPHLSNPYWTLHAAASQSYSDSHWPQSYVMGRDQLQRLLTRPDYVGLV